MKINYVVGDATRPVGDGQKIIAHGCNNVGAWGAGFTGALSSRWRDPEIEYREAFSLGGRLRLGDVQLVVVESDIDVANLVTQSGLISSQNPHPFSYEGFELALKHLRCLIENENNVSIHMPRIGAGLGGGDWPKIESIIEHELCNHGIPVTVYDLE